MPAMIYLHRSGEMQAAGAVAADVEETEATAEVMAEAAGVEAAVVDTEAGVAATN